MSIILGLMILCLGLYFLSLFFQVARLEKSMSDSVTLMERFMMVKHAMTDESGKKAEADDGEPEKPGKKA